MRAKEFTLGTARSASPQRLEHFPQSTNCWMTQWMSFERVTFHKLPRFDWLKPFLLPRDFSPHHHCQPILQIPLSCSTLEFLNLFEIFSPEFVPHGLFVDTYSLSHPMWHHLLQRTTTEVSVTCASSQRAKEKHSKLFASFFNWLINVAANANVNFLSNCPGQKDDSLKWVCFLWTHFFSCCDKTWLH